MPEKQSIIQVGSQYQDLHCRLLIYLFLFYKTLGYMQHGISGNHCGGHSLKYPLILNPESNLKYINDTFIYLEQYCTNPISH